MTKPNALKYRIKVNLDLRSKRKKRKKTKRIVEIGSEKRSSESYFFTEVCSVIAMSDCAMQ